MTEPAVLDPAPPAPAAPTPTPRLHRTTQALLPALTLTGMTLTSSRHPATGILFTAAAQPLWLLSSWRAWRDARQLGLLLNTLAAAAIIGYGVWNWWIR